MKKKPKILIVEDNIPVLKALNDYFSDRCSIVSATNGKDAIQIFDELKAQKLDLNIVITDIVMPEMDGIELTKLLKAKDPKLPIICITGYDDKERNMAAKKASANAVFTKPFDLIDLNRKVYELLQKAAKYTATKTPRSK